MDATPIIIGGREFPVRPLTIGQLSTIYPEIFQGAALGTPEGFERALRCIASAIDDPSVTVEGLKAMPSTIPELSAAFVAVMKLAGLTLGERGAGAASGGASSTAA